MNQPLTPERLAEIREREQAATAGPWGTYYDGHGTYTVQSGCRLSLATGFTSDGDIATLHGEHGDGQTYANATFIARARDDVRALLDELDRADADLKAFADRLNKLESSLCECSPERERKDYRRPALYQHEATCPAIPNS